MENNYDVEFYNRQKYGSKTSAGKILPIVFKQLSFIPKSVIDVGCGTGTWLEACTHLGIEDITGIDGNYVDRDLLLIDRTKFIPVDLNGDFKLDRRFDLVISLEVAEHLSMEKSARFVENLTRLGDTVLFSAAIPGQGGTDHVNEAFPGFWIKLFEKNGFQLLDIVRKHIWEDKEIDFWYRQNILIFVRQDNLRNNPALNKDQNAVSDKIPYFYNRIHPELYMIYVNEKAKLLSENALQIKKSRLFNILLTRILKESGNDLKLLARRIKRSLFT